MNKITSTSNKTYKFIKSLAMKKNRVEHGYFIVEGKKSTQEAISSDYTVKMIIVSESALREFTEFIKSFENLNAEIYEINDSLFASLSDTKTPEGILCVVEMKKNEGTDYKDGLYLYCDNVSDPGNAGTLIRCADAVGASGVLLSKGCVDVYNPKTVRSTMGSIFHLPVVDAVEYDIIRDMKKKGFKIFAGALCDTALDYRNTEYPKKSVIIVGNEANGVSKELLEICDEKIIIPIWGRAESLNVSVAGSILMYEWRRNN